MGLSVPASSAEQQHQSWFPWGCGNRWAIPTAPTAGSRLLLTLSNRLVLAPKGLLRPTENPEDPIFLKNPLNLTEKQLETWDRLKDGDFKTLKAHRLYLAFRDIWDYPPEQAPAALGRWISWALRSRVEPMVKAAQTIRQHVPSILRVLSNDLTTAVMEGINSLVQAARARARGYRNPDNFITIIYLIVGKLDLRFAHTK